MSPRYDFECALSQAQHAEVAEPRADATLEAQPRGLGPAPQRSLAHHVRVAEQLADDDPAGRAQDASA
jgi:hypothetical protein